MHELIYASEKVCLLHPEHQNQTKLINTLKSAHKSF